MREPAKNTAFEAATLAKLGIPEHPMNGPLDSAGWRALGSAKHYVLGTVRGRGLEPEIRQALDRGRRPACEAAKPPTRESAGDAALEAV